MTRGCIAKLSDGPLDIIGDIHGELSALESLREKLGYRRSGRHPDGRKLVFVGDLIDRGPDSPGVLRTVMEMVEGGYAQCIVGNHELNAIRDDPDKKRAGEGWWYSRDEDKYESKPVDKADKMRTFMPFLTSLPLALERDDLRVVHACWHDESIESLRNEESVHGAFTRQEENLRQQLERLHAEFESVRTERRCTPEKLRAEEPRVELIPELARLDEAKQMGNAVKVVTSGIERQAADSFYASGKWRMVRRVPWWQDHTGTPVVVGHYWRRYFPDPAANPEKGANDMFGATPPHVVLGLEGKVMCIDYSVGTRFAERGRETPASFGGCLAALRIPEWELVFDDRHGLPVTDRWGVRFLGGD